MQSAAHGTRRNGLRGLIPWLAWPIRAPVLLMALGTGALGCGASRPAHRPITPRPTTTPAEQRKLAEAKDLFYASVGGDRQALPRAQEIFDQLGGGDSADPRVIAYTGAAKLLQASRADNFFQKAGLGRQGMDLVDKAVSEAPEDMEVRFLQGVTFYQLPPFLGRRQTAVSDLASVARVAEAEVKAGRLDRRAAAADLVYYGKTREEAYDAAGAIAAWRAAVRIDATGPGRRDALKHLAEHHASP
jgi:hypothetical protein